MVRHIFDTNLHQAENLKSSGLKNSFETKNPNQCYYVQDYLSRLSLYQSIISLSDNYAIRVRVNKQKLGSVQ